MTKQRVKLSDQLRQAVDASGMSRYRVAKVLGIPESSMSKFMAGKGLRLDSLDALADLLELDIKARKGN